MHIWRMLGMSYYILFGIFFPHIILAFALGPSKLALCWGQLVRAVWKHPEFDVLPDAQLEGANFFS